MRWLPDPGAHAAAHTTNVVRYRIADGGMTLRFGAVVDRLDGRLRVSDAVQDGELHNGNRHRVLGF